MDRSQYFDNAATTPLDSRVREAMLPFLGESFGNANSIHSWGQQAHEAVEKARAQVAKLIGAEDPSQIYFTSGATEANNWVLNAALAIVTSPFEHSAVREPALQREAVLLKNKGVELEPHLGASFHPAYMKICAMAEGKGDSGSDEEVAILDGIEDAEMKAIMIQAAEEARRRRADFRNHLKRIIANGHTLLLSVMAVNNEIGTIWDVRDYAQDGDLVHSDITQAVGKVPTVVEGLDFASFSAHKFYGPKGIGCLYCRDQPPPPLILGGEQEQGFRGGTLNVAAIVGMGEAAQIACEEQPQDYARAAQLKEILLDGLNGLADMQTNGGARTSPFIVSVSFRGLEGESIVLEMDRAGYAISAGAACSSRSTEPSHVLRALNLKPEWLRGTIRISFGRFNTKEATASLAKKLRATVEMFRTL